MRMSSSVDTKPEMSHTGGVKPMSITGKTHLEKYRLEGMTPEVCINSSLWVLCKYTDVYKRFRNVSGERSG